MCIFRAGVEGLVGAELEFNMLRYGRLCRSDQSSNLEELVYIASCQKSASDVRMNSSLKGVVR